MRKVGILQLGKMVIPLLSELPIEISIVKSNVYTPIMAKKVLWLIRNFEPIRCSTASKYFNFLVSPSQ